VGLTTLPIFVRSGSMPGSRGEETIVGTACPGSVGDEHSRHKMKPTITPKQPNMNAKVLDFTSGLSLDLTVPHWKCSKMPDVEPRLQRRHRLGSFSGAAIGRPSFHSIGITDKYHVFPPVLLP